MSIKPVAYPLLLLVLSVGVLAHAQRGERGAPQPPRPDNPQSLTHIDAAKKLAGDDPFLSNPFNFYCVAGKARAQNNAAPALEPVKLFDNLYAFGNSETTVYGLTTSSGIVLFDSGFADKTESEVIAGMQKLGLDPAKVKYILLGHGHADHFGGAKYFQDHYGTQVATTAADWDLIHPPTPSANANPNAANQVRPRKDVVLTGGQPFKVGDVAITTVAIPGHTPGSLGYIFPVKDKGKTRMAGLFGGAILTTNIITTEGLKQYVQSIANYLDVARKMKVEVEIQNHPIFDGMPEKLAKLKDTKGKDPNPFVVGTDRYVKMWNIISECMQAEIARREAPAN
jgi:metallo-beta-lactamase class B